MVRKELRDLFRDRRTLFIALLMGPILLPVIMIGLGALASKKISSQLEKTLEVPVIGMYGHTNPWRVGPYRKYENLWIDKYTDGAPDPSTFEPQHGRMELITVEEVLAKVGLGLQPR